MVTKQSRRLIRSLSRSATSAVARSAGRTPPPGVGNLGGPAARLARVLPAPVLARGEPLLRVRLLPLRDLAGEQEDDARGGDSGEQVRDDANRAPPLDVPAPSLLPIQRTSLPGFYIAEQQQQRGGDLRDCW
ncbi:unnamed protein product [Urochloa humidicola]